MVSGAVRVLQALAALAVVEVAVLAGGFVAVSTLAQQSTLALTQLLVGLGLGAVVAGPPAILFATTAIRGRHPGGRLSLVVLAVVGGIWLGVLTLVALAAIGLEADGPGCAAYLNNGQAAALCGGVLHSVVAIALVYAAGALVAGPIAASVARRR